MKRIICVMTACMLCVPVFTVPADAEPDYNDTEYWEEKCTGYSEEDADACLAYREYLNNQKGSLQDRLDEIDSQREAIKADIEAYGAQISDLQVQIDDLQVEINQKQAEIDAKQAEIDAKQIEIDAKQIEIENKQAEIDDTQSSIDKMKGKIKNRMAASQSTMRINKYLDILMGADTFEEFLRILLGLDAIAKYDKKTMDELADLIELLNRQKGELETAKAELETVRAQMETVKAEMEAQQQALVAQQDDLQVLQYQVMVVEEEAKAKEADLRAASAQIAADISNITATMASLAAAGKLDDIPSVASTGWTWPVPGSYRSAGTWAYSSGYEHLGYDFAAAVGTPIYAVGSGVILSSVNGCATYGGLGNMCGYQFGGAYGGGNQVHYLVVVNGSLYGIAAYHMQLNSPIASGTIVTGGTLIGYVGSSGNSSGPHCHIEIIYLGDGSKFSSYAQNWNGDLAFGAGWQGNNRKCDYGYGAPCRIRPESVFGE